LVNMFALPVTLKCGPGQVEGLKCNALPTNGIKASVLCIGASQADAREVMLKDPPRNSGALSWFLRARLAEWRDSGGKELRLSDTARHLNVKTGGHQELQLTSSAYAEDLFLSDYL